MRVLFVIVFLAMLCNASYAIGQDSLVSVTGRVFHEMDVAEFVSSGQNHGEIPVSPFQNLDALEGLMREGGDSTMIVPLEFVRVYALPDEKIAEFILFQMKESFMLIEDLEVVSWPFLDHRVSITDTNGTFSVHNVPKDGVLMFVPHDCAYDEYDFSAVFYNKLACISVDSLIKNPNVFIGKEVRELIDPGPNIGEGNPSF